MTIDGREGARRASAYLRYPYEEALESLREVPEIDGFYFGQSGRGGGQVLIGRDGTVLFGVSALTIQDMIARWNDGRRTDPAAFAIE
ncbi:hypothetical protein [Sanguibacter sp. 25GB23B1]|uniref:hypothetical protein n=1 Tax=unclassified Sanguibacter TaxID=2645534 RepID=UPI0032B02349